MADQLQNRGNDAASLSESGAGGPARVPYVYPDGSVYGAPAGGGAPASQQAGVGAATPGTPGAFNTPGTPGAPGAYTSAPGAAPGSYAAPTGTTPSGAYAGYGAPGATVASAANYVPAVETAAWQQGAQTVHTYSRSNYEQGTGAGASDAYALVSEKRRKRKRRRVIGGVLGVLLGIVVLLGAGAFFYTNSIDAKLAGGSSKLDITDKLTPEVADEPFYTLIIGSDSRESDPDKYETSSQHSDIMILARIDRKKDVVTLVTIPRDTPWTTEDGNVVKMNTLYNNGGARATIDAVSKLTGVPISHYAEAHFLQFEELVDTLGGITYNVPVDMEWYDPMAGEYVTLAAGEQTLNGQQATLLVRDRHNYEGNQDAGRQSTVRSVIMAIFNKVKESPLTDYPRIVDAAASCVTTDLSSVGAMLLAADLSSNVTFYSATGPYDGEIDPVLGKWFCYEDPEGWARLMEVVDAGEDPSGVTYEEDEVTYPGNGEVVPKEEPVEG